jgi:ankyrin repeat protein
MVKLILKNRFNPSSEDLHQLLQSAAETGNRDIFCLIAGELSKDGDNDDDGDDGSVGGDFAFGRSLEIACTNGSSGIVYWILKMHPEAVSSHHFITACEHGHADIANTLIDCDADGIRGLDCPFTSVLEVWRRAGDRVPEPTKDAILTLMLDDYGVDDYFEECLWQAAGGGGTCTFLRRLMKEARALIEEDPYYVDQLLMKALDSACEHSNLSLIEFSFAQLRGRGVMMAATRFLKTAARSFRKEAFELLVDLYRVDAAGAPPGALYDLDEVFLYACACGSADVARRLLEGGKCDVNKVHRYAYAGHSASPVTALAVASDPAVVRLLLDHKADIKPPGCVSVLAMSARRVQAEAVQLLLAAGADARGGLWPPTEPCALARLALFPPAGLGNSDEHVAVINLLLKAGMPTAGALHMCADSATIGRCADGSFLPTPEPVMRALIAHDPALLNAPDRDGMTPLMAAVALRNTSAAKFLLEAGADLDRTSSWGMTALMMSFLDPPPSPQTSYLPANRAFTGRRHVHIDRYDTTIHDIARAVLTRASNAAAATAAGEGDASRTRKRQKRK